MHRYQRATECSDSQKPSQKTTVLRSSICLVPPSPPRLSSTFCSRELVFVIYSYLCFLILYSIFRMQFERLSGYWARWGPEDQSHAHDSRSFWSPLAYQFFALSYFIIRPFKLCEFSEYSFGTKVFGALCCGCRMQFDFDWSSLSRRYLPCSFPPSPSLSPSLFLSPPKSPTFTLNVLFH